MIRSISTEVDMAALGPDPDPLKVLTIAANKVKMMPFSFLGKLVIHRSDIPHLFYSLFCCCNRYPR